MKRFSIVILLLAFVFLFSACDNNAFDSDESFVSEAVSEESSQISSTESQDIEVSEMPDESGEASDVSPMESEGVSEDVEASEDESAVSEAESEVSEDVSAEESVYEVVYHTEYKPIFPGVDENEDIAYSFYDQWHNPEFFEYPRSDFREYFSDRITSNNYSLFRNAFIYSDHQAISYGFWLEYFKITKEEYIAYLDYVLETSDNKEIYRLDYCDPLIRYVDGWYGENYWLEPLHIDPNAAYVPKDYHSKTRDGKHNSLYYIIPGRLIEHVGEKEFKKFLDKYEGTTDCNILTFIDYFDIDYKKYTKIYSQKIESDSYQLQRARSYQIHVPRFLFGSKEEQDAYFGFYDDDISALDVFNPKTPPSSETVFYNYSKFYDGQIFFFNNQFMIHYLGYEDKSPLVKPEVEHEFERLFSGTMQHNYAFFIDYYGITEKEWIDFLHSTSLPSGSGYLISDLDLLFREDNFMDSFKTDSPAWDICEYETYFGEIIDDKYNQVYYTIDRMLIKHVGIKAFNKFLEKYEGTADCNIIKFLEFNELSINDLRYVYRSSQYRSDIMPYNFKILYMDSDSEDFQKYFGYGTLDR